MQLSFGRSASLSVAQKAAIAQVSQWALAHLLQSNAFLRREDAQLIVTEVQCSDPDCVPVETFIAVVIDERFKGVLDPLRLTAKVLKPVVEASEEDVYQLDLSLRFVDERIASTVSLIEDALSEREGEREGELGMDLFARFLSARVRPNTHTQQATTVVEKQTTSSQQTVSQAQPIARAITRVPMRATAAPALSLSLAQTLSPSAVAAPPLPAIKSTERSISKSSTPPNTSQTNAASSNMTTETVTAPITTTAALTDTTHTNTTTTSTTPSSEPLSSSSTIPHKRDFREVLQERRRNEEKVSVSARHSKEEKRRGCPCCDPDNLDHLLDKIMFMEYPPV